jgi:molecular chaperone GrpE (heat shock protein)
MPEERSGGTGLRFRLPKRNNETNESKPASESSLVSSVGPADSAVTNPADTPEQVGAQASGAASQQVATSSMMASQNAPGPGPITPTILSQQITTQTNAIAQEMARLRSEIELMQRAMVELGERESNQAKVFDVLHKELGDYKNDFIYEHLKPVIRPLLFLYDSLVQFEAEVEPFERMEGEERRQILSPNMVKENARYFQDQLIEALRVCEVTLMEQPEGTFNPKLHKAVDVVAVPPEQDNTIQRVVRAGWYLRGHLFRPAEVVVGRSSLQGAKGSQP